MAPRTFSLAQVIDGLDWAADWVGDHEVTKSPLFRQIIDMLPQCIFWKDRNGTFLGCNLGGARAIGLPHPDEIVGKTDFDFHRDQAVAEYLRLEDERVLNDGIPIYRHLSQGSGPAESARWYETSKIPLRDEHGDIFGLLISYEDVTERESTQEELRTTNQHLDVAANYTSNWSMWIDGGGRLRWVSPAVEAVCGYTVAECAAMANYPLPIVHPDDRPRVRAFFAREAAKDGEALFRFLRKDGELRFGSVTRRLVADRYGNATGIRYSVNDITAQRRAEDELLQLNASLERRIHEATVNALRQERLLLRQSSQAAMGEMLGNIAHQWRQPLTALGLLLQNIRYDSEAGILDHGALGKRLDRAGHLIDQMSSTIDDFRNFFRPVDGDATVDVCACIGNALKLMDASLKHAQVSLLVEYEEPCCVVGRANELGQVMLNLLTNAKDVLVERRSGDRRIEIRVARVEDGHVAIRVRDNGGGIADENLVRLFDPDFTTKKQGTGLGLYIVKQIITQHFQGAVDCGNAEGGAEFVVTLPLAPAESLGADMACKAAA